MPPPIFLSLGLGDIVLELLNVNPFPDAGDFNFCHHVIFVSKPL